jgi:hypothetical protein
VKRLAAVATVAIGVFMLPSAAGGQSPPTEDSVVGGAMTDQSAPFQIAYYYFADARSGPNGENPTGTLGWGCLQCPTATPRFPFDVTCLNVVGNKAIIGYLTRRDRLSGGFLIPGVAVVEDNGPPRQGVLVDRFGFSHDTSHLPADGPPITSCPPSIAEDVPLSTEHFLQPGPLFGDFVVTDSHALPTSKHECKNGGWKSFGVFKNQGDCVSFVTTSGKNPPANSP